MKFQFRGQLNDKTVVDIIKFDKDVALCNNGVKINIDEFNTIFYQKDKFKKEILGIND